MFMGFDRIASLFAIKQYFKTISSIYVLSYDAIADSAISPFIDSFPRFAFVHHVSVSLALTSNEAETTKFSSVFAKRLNYASSLNCFSCLNIEMSIQDTRCFEGGSQRNGHSLETDDVSNKV